jgi:Integrase core domain
MNGSDGPQSTFWSRLPFFRPRSPNLNAYAERWVRSVKEECLSNVILFGEKALRHSIGEYVEHYHKERNHQGRGNELILPFPRSGQMRDGPIKCRERIGGLLKHYYKKAGVFFDHTGSATTCVIKSNIMPIFLFANPSSSFFYMSLVLFLVPLPPVLQIAFV